MTDARRAALIVVSLVVIYNANLRGIGSVDTHVTEYLAYSLATTGRADLDDFPELHATGVVRGYVSDYDGRMRSNHPVVPALLAAPAYWSAVATGLIAAEAPSRRRVEAVGKVAASTTTALACGVLFLVIRRRLTPGPAMLLAMAAGLATPFWSTASQALWSHGAGALLLALAMLADDDRPTARQRWRAGGAGLLVTLAAASRPLLAGFAGGLTIAVLVRRDLRQSMAFALGAAAVVGALWLYDDTSPFGPAELGRSRLESPEIHRAVHDVTTAWNPSPMTGLAGLLVSPSRGMLIFMPVAVLAAAGAREAWRDRRGRRWTLLLPTVAFVAGWSSYAVWWGGHSYGPRYAADLVVPLTLLACPVVARLADGSARVGTRAAVGVLLAWSIGVQAIGAFGYPGGNWNGSPADVDRAHARLWDWRDSQIPRTFRALPYRRD